MFCTNSFWSVTLIAVHRAQRLLRRVHQPRIPLSLSAAHLLDLGVPRRLELAHGLLPLQMPALEPRTPAHHELLGVAKPAPLRLPDLHSRPCASHIGRRCVVVPNSCRALSSAHERCVPSFSQSQMHPWRLCRAPPRPPAGGQVAAGRAVPRRGLRSAAV
eukprot:COSAG04_NODE_1115_length_8208_cov_1.971883_5_plen_160_part_00